MLGRLHEPDQDGRDLRRKQAGARDRGWPDIGPRSPYLLLALLLTTLGIQCTQFLEASFGAGKLIEISISRF